MPNQNKNLHPLCQNILERRLQEIEYLERQQKQQDSFATQMYGKQDYREERNNILKELLHGKQSRSKESKYPDEKFWDIIDRQIGKEKHPQIPEAVSREIARFQRQYSREYEIYIQEIKKFQQEQRKDDKKSWSEINQDIQKGKTTPTELSNVQWENILEKSAQDLQTMQQQTAAPYCNIYARDQLLQEGIYMPPNQVANQMIEYMKNHPEFFKKLPKRTDTQGKPTQHLDHQEAFDKAQTNPPILSVYQNPTGKEGHIVVVNPHIAPSYSNSWKTNVTNVNGFNSTTRKIHEGELLSVQFSPQREPHMDYYEYIGPRRTKEQKEKRKNIETSAE